MHLYAVVLIALLAIYLFVGIVFFAYDWYHQRPGVMSVLSSSEVVMYIAIDILFWPLGLRTVIKAHRMKEDPWDLDRANELQRSSK